MFDRIKQFILKVRRSYYAKRLAKFNRKRKALNRYINSQKALKGYQLNHEKNKSSKEEENTKNC